ncbi:hypothetical protein [Pseudomonas sp.]|nr:hypothetical protein [Pseudomonas sp.]MDX1366094.1 hypothetical protein [Pseudomonas sp.]
MSIPSLYVVGYERRHSQRAIAAMTKGSVEGPHRYGAEAGRLLMITH